MEYRRLGKSGLRVSVIGLGGNTFGRYADERQTAAIVQQAIESGINMIDTADVYGHGASEELLGKAIRGHRDDLVIATKVGGSMGDGPNESGSSRRHILAGCEASLRRLGIETIDLYQIHWFDPKTPLEETLGALDDLVRAGKVRYIGCSNYDAWRIVQALWISDQNHLNHYVSVQPEYNLLKREIEAEIVPVCLEFGLGVIPYFPLDAGVLTGKYQPGEEPPPGTRGHENPRFSSRLGRATLEAVQRVDAWAHESGHTVAELALAWLASRPAVSTIIAGTTKPEQVAANARAADWKLTPGDLAEVERLLAG
ncbi:MAG TPA: aldo/keto reductase [Ktedonobacterales bacterium]|nr:aldo/keto reductase [Ktedonobacterales bacterium]